MEADNVLGHSGSNGRLEVFINLLYGAVLAYGLYQIAGIIRQIYITFHGFSNGTIDSIHFSSAIFLQIILYSITSFFLICDFSGMTKVNYFFPYIRPSRFFIDATIPFLYLLLFIACAERSVLFPFLFSLVLFLCGAWGNNLYVEALSFSDSPPAELRNWDIYDITKYTAENYGIIIRNSHILGGLLLNYTTIVLFLWNQDAAGDPLRELTLPQCMLVVTILIVWYVGFIYYAVKSTKSVDHLLLPLLPGVLKKIIKRLFKS
jgi:hypothetical protein